MSSLAELVDRRELLWNLTLREMRGRYKRSMLGWTWSMLNPLATMGIYTFVFAVVLRSDPPPGDPSGLKVYALFLVCGLLPWNFFAITVGVGMSSVVSNGSLVKKVAFPREHLVVSTVLAGLLTFGIELGVLSVVLLIAGNMVLPWLPLVIVASLLLSLFTTGLALVLAAANVYFRDLTYLWTIVSQLWFFGTPVVYPASLLEGRNIPGWLLRAYNDLPMAVAARLFRALLYDLKFPRLLDFGLLGGYGVAMLAIGWLVFSKLSGRFAEEL